MRFNSGVASSILGDNSVLGGGNNISGGGGGRAFSSRGGSVIGGRGGPLLQPLPHLLQQGLAPDAANINSNNNNSNTAGGVGGAGIGGNNKPIFKGLDKTSAAICFAHSNLSKVVRSGSPSCDAFVSSPMKSSAQRFAATWRRVISAGTVRGFARPSQKNMKVNVSASSRSTFTISSSLSGFLGFKDMRVTVDFLGVSCVSFILASSRPSHESGPSCSCLTWTFKGDTTCAAAGDARLDDLVD